MQLFTETQTIFIVKCLEHPDNSIVKRGLQYLSQELQNGVRPASPSVFRNSLINHKQSPDVKVRSWLYNVIGRLKDHSFVDYLVFQVLLGENDIENIGWAFAALFSCANEREIEKILQHPDIEFKGSYVELASQLYYRGPRRVEMSSQFLDNRIEDDPEFAKWYCILAGYDRLEDRGVKYFGGRKTTLPELNRHHEPQVVEYSLWALHMSKTLGGNSTTLKFDDALSLPNNVRRWYYKVLSQNRGDFLSHIDMIEDRTLAERDVFAREGLAQSIENIFDRRMTRFVSEWFSREDNLKVRLALLSHLFKFSEHEAVYRNIVEEVFTDESNDELLTTRILSLISQTNPGHQSRILLNLRNNRSRKSTGDVKIMASEKGPTNVVINSASGNSTISIGDVVQRGEILSDSIEKLKKDPQKSPLGTMIEALYHGTTASSNTDTDAYRAAIATLESIVHQLEDRSISSDERTSLVRAKLEHFIDIIPEARSVVDRSADAMNIIDKKEL